MTKKCNRFVFLTAGELLEPSEVSSSKKTSSLFSWYGIGFPVWQSWVWASPWLVTLFLPRNAFPYLYFVMKIGIHLQRKDNIQEKITDQLRVYPTCQHTVGTALISMQARLTVQLYPATSHHARYNQDYPLLGDCSSLSTKCLAAATVAMFATHSLTKADVNIITSK